MPIPDPKCLKCGGEVGWGEPTGVTGARGHARCLGPRFRSPCGWTGNVVRQADKSVRAVSG